MTNMYTMPWRKLALTALLGLGTTGAFAQALNYVAATAQNVAGTYTDLGATGTVITTANTDDANSAATPIGFTFNYNGTAFTDFVLNTNGFIKLGTAAPSAPNVTNFFADAANSNIIAAAAGVDLQGAADQTASPTQYSVSTSGASGSRVCTIQFKNVSDKATVGTTTTPAQFATMQFQIKLYEGTNTIELVYGAWTGNGATATGQPFLIGLRGTTVALTDRLLASKTSSATPWTTTTFAQSVEQNGAVFLPSHFVRNSFLPDPGRTYRFVVAPANDAAVQTIYSLGKVPAATPQEVQAVVMNAGSAPLTNLAVSLNVTGANTFADGKTIASLAPGTSTIVTFSTFTPTVVGNNTFTVTVPGDAVATNNSRTYTQAVTANTFSYANDISFGPNSGIGFTAATTGAFVAKFTTLTARTISSIGAGLADVNTVGRTMYAIVVNSSGALVARSADYVVQMADINQIKSFALTSAVPVAAGDFYVGLVQTAVPTGGVRYFPMATLPEVPTRPDTFFQIAPFTATGGTLTDLAANNLGAFVLEAQTSIVQGTSAALNRAVAMYPNPASGVVTLAVQGAKATGQLNVSVINQLGQTVHTQRLQDNFTNQVNLSALANGIYLLKVQTGNEYTTRQLVLTK